MHKLSQDRARTPADTARVSGADVETRGVVRGGVGAAPATPAALKAHYQTNAERSSPFSFFVPENEHCPPVSFSY